MKNLFLICISFLFIACGTSTKQVLTPLNNEESTFLKTKPEELQSAYKKLIQEGERNKVLNYQKIALDAYQLGYKDIAKINFDKALNEIESMYSNEENAQKARSLWHEEGKKDFKGEPYERVMAFYYRGLQYLDEKDYENARASFKSAILQDAFAEEEQNQCDFSLVVLMEAISSKFNENNDLFEESLKDMKLLRPQLNIPDNFNTIFIFETGNSPRKVADGVGHSQLKFRRGKKFKEDSLYLTLNNDKIKANLVEDIYWQATSRGGRYFDSILKGKANFKQMNSKVAENFAKLSSTISLVNSIGSSSDTLGVVGAGLGIISGIALISSVNTDARADTRYWNNLPDKVHVIFANLKEGKHDIKLDFVDKNNQIISSLSKKEIIKVNATNNIFRFSSRSRLSSTYKK